MKRAVTVLAALVCLAAGAVHGLDLSAYNDWSTGFVTWGSVWTRYGVLAGVLVLAGVAALVQTPGPYRITAPSRGLGVFGLLASVLFAAYAGGQVMLLWPERDWFGLVQAVLFFLTGLWLLLTGLAHLGEELTPPTHSAVLGVGATLGFYLLTVGRFGFAPSSVERIGPTVEVFSALLALLLSTALVRLLYVGQVRSGRWLYFLGFAAFFLCTCLELPQTFLSWRNGADGLADLALSLLLALIGLAGLGAAWAVSGQQEDTLPDEDD